MENQKANEPIPMTIHNSKQGLQLSDKDQSFGLHNFWNTTSNQKLQEDQVGGDRFATHLPTLKKKGHLETFTVATIKTTCFVL